MNTRVLWTMVGLLIGTGMSAAQGAAMESRLARALELYPDADADKDGKLTMAEALGYAGEHPELAALLGEMRGGKRKPKVMPPAAPLPGAADLPPGPRVFVCAHSFMIFTAAQLPAMAHAAGIGYRDAGRQMIGGSRVIQHWNVPDAENMAKAALREGRVDVLTLSPHMLLPDEGIDHFVRLGIEKNPGLRVLVQASWPARDGEFGGGFRNGKRDEATVESLRKMGEGYRATWLNGLEAQVRSLNASIGREAVGIIPVSDAVLALRERIAEGKAPGLGKQTDLFRDDLGHPLPPLAALVSYCHFASIFGRSPVGLPVPEAIKGPPQAGELNGLLQQIAWDAVTRYPMSGVRGAVDGIP